MGVGYTDTRRMRPRDVLAINLKRLMAATPSLSTFPQITQAGGGANGTLDRIRRKASATSVDNLEPLARAYGLEPWHLLLPTLTATPGADGKPVITGTPAWPFTSIDPASFQNLDQDQKLLVEQALAKAIDAGEAVTNDRIKRLGAQMDRQAGTRAQQKKRG